jgi:hypothetical protein
VNRVDLCAIADELKDLLDQVAEMQRDCAHGRLPQLADAKLTVTRAGLLRDRIELAHVARLQSTPAPSDEEDRASQVGMALQHHDAADAAAKWSAA